MDNSNTRKIENCLFLESYNLSEHSQTPYFHFGFPWYILPIPNCFGIISYSLILVTSLEFISAQAPQPMKGLVFGLFFAIKGIFVFLATVFLIPFSLKAPTKILSHAMSCGFGYFFLTLIVSLVGLVLFACVRRKYKYRRRDEEPFSQAVVEEIFERRLQHNADESLLESSDIVLEREDASVMRPADCVFESEEVRASEWFVAPGERSGHSMGEPSQLESPDNVPESGERRCSGRVRMSVHASMPEGERNRGSGWFVGSGVRRSRGGEPHERLLSMSHDWYGTFLDDGNIQQCPRNGTDTD